MQSPLRSAALCKHPFVPPADHSPAVLTYELCCGTPHRVLFHTKVHVKRQEALVKPGFSCHCIFVNREAMQLRLQKTSNICQGQLTWATEATTAQDRRSVDNNNCLVILIILILLICSSRRSLLVYEAQFIS